MRMPTGKYAVLGFRGEVVGDANNSVPLSQVYDHHWILEDRYHQNVLCPNGPQYVFGIGAESRHTPANFPDGFGYIVEPNDEFGGNIHLLHTVDLEGDSAAAAAKLCNECYYAPNKGPECTPAMNGTFQCCGDRCYSGVCKCPTKPGTKMVPTNFYLRYTVNFTRDTQKVAPIGIGTWTTPNCATFYGVQRNDENPESRSETSFVVEASGELIYAIGHQHVGAINISLFKNGEPACTSYPTYGSELGVAGNEKGYLIQMSECLNKQKGKSLKLQKGDHVSVVAYYWVGSEDPRIAPLPGGTHLNVMAYMYTAYTLDGPAPTPSPVTKQCAAALEKYCGDDVGLGKVCDECATQHYDELKSAGCTVKGVKAACSNPSAGTVGAVPVKNVPWMRML